MNGKRWMVLGVAMLMLCVAGTWSVSNAATGAKDMLGGPPIMRLVSGQIGRLLVLRSEVNLTSEQRAQLKDIVDKNRKDLAVSAKRVHEQKLILRDAMLAENPDEAQIRAASKAMSDVVGDLAVKVSKVAGEGRKVLTPEQLAQIKKTRGECEAAIDAFIKQAIAQ